MGIFSKLFSKTPEQIVARLPTGKLEDLVKSSAEGKVRYLAARRLNREEIWQYLALHDPENFTIAVLNCKDLQFLDKLRDLKPEKKYFIQEHMDRVAFPVVQKKIEACSNQEQLLALVMHNKTDIPEYKYLYSNSVSRIQTQTLYKLTKQEDLFLIATSKEGQTAMDAISRISDPDLLVRIVLAPEHNTFKKYNKVLSMLHDTDRLQYIAEHSEDSYIVQLAKRRIKEEKSSLLCHDNHDWIELRTESDDDGDSPRLDYVYEKCTRCGVVRCTTYIARRLHSAELRYDTEE